MKKIGGAICVFLVGVVGWWLVRVPPPPPEASMSFASTTVVVSQLAGVEVGLASTLPPPMITVHIAGAVKNPGVYKLRFGARINDGVIAAGGATNAANVDVVNLATVLNDGEQIYVPKRGEKPHVIVSRPQVGGSADSVGGSSSGVAGTSGAGSALINLNLASAIELEQLPGVGPTTAKAIIAYREKNGAFARVEDLLKVSGIGPAKLREILPRVRVN